MIFLHDLNKSTTGFKDFCCDFEILKVYSGLNEMVFVLGKDCYAKLSYIMLCYAVYESY